MKLLNDPRCRQEILTRLNRVRPDSPRRWGRMNAHQMICHASDSFLGVMGERQVQVPARFRGRRLMRVFALHTPVRWPKGVATMPEVDAEIGGTAPLDFATDKENLMAVMERFIQQPRSFSFQPHPIFLELTEREWMTWAYRHMDHHLRQFGQ